MKPVVFICEEDPEILKLLSLIIERAGYEVQGFQNIYNCSPCKSEKCTSLPGKACADALIINSKSASTKDLQILEDLDRKGCKLSKRKKAIMSSVFVELKKEDIQRLGYTTVKKPFKPTAIVNWLNTCLL